MAKKNRAKSGRERSSKLRNQMLYQRYLQKDDRGEVVETPKQMFRRVADAVVASETEHGASEQEIAQLAKKFYRLMASGMFLQ